MRLIIQKVKKSIVYVNGEVYGQIGNGMHVLLGIEKEDSPAEVNQLVQKLLKIRLWKDSSGKSWRKNIIDISGEIMIVSQFTLYATLNRKQKSPNFHHAMNHERSRVLYELFIKQIRETYIPEKINTGMFQNHMEISLICDGPVTICIESSQKISD